MFAKHPIAGIAMLLADSSRVAMLISLIGGESRPAGELARIAGVSAQAASAHLAKLTDAELLCRERSGRHHYYRIAKPEVAIAIESIAAVTPHPKRPSLAHERPEHQMLRYARTCYDHLAGQLAIELCDCLLKRDFLRSNESWLDITSKGSSKLKEIGIESSALRTGKRPLVKPCLDWTERKPHIAGALGSALLASMRERQWIISQTGSRAVRLTDVGRQGLESLLDTRLDVGPLLKS
jgi:DNA-binding transcriptional ArsR family regulator